jgi:acetyl esterase/lipase
VVGPGVTVDREALRRVSFRAADPLSVDIAVVPAPTLSALVESVRALGAKVDGLVLDFGTAVEAPEARAAVHDTGLPAIAVDIRVASSPGVDPVTLGCIGRVRGRGIAGFEWAIRQLVDRCAWPFTTLAYGTGPDQVGDLRLPECDRRAPLVVLVHGGGWKEQWERELMDGLGVDLARHGIATWNLGYRRVGPSGGGWPTTFEDVATGIEFVSHLAERFPVDPHRVALLGHSAGGQLALWAAARTAPTDPGPEVRLPLAGVVSVAGVTDLVEAANRGLISGENAVVGLLGGLPDEVPDRYELASPLSRLPVRVPTLLVQGTDDYIQDLVDMNRRFAAAARSAGDGVTLLELEGVEHLDPIDPRSDAWAVVRAKVSEMVER